MAVNHCPAAGDVTNKQYHEDHEPKDRGAESLGPKVEEAVGKINADTGSEDAPTAVVAQVQIHESNEPKRKQIRQGPQTAGWISGKKRE